MTSLRCNHTQITHLGETGANYTGPLFVCSVCGKEWRSPEIRTALHQQAQYESVLKDIANEDNIWIDPAVAAKNILDGITE